MAIQGDYGSRPSSAVRTPRADTFTKTQPRLTEKPQSNALVARDRFDPPRTQPYVVQSGDTLTGIADRFHTKVDDIMRANPSLTNPNEIRAGMTLQIPVTAAQGTNPPPPTPSTTTYTVKPGETLTGIAAQHGTTVPELLALNPTITDPNTIQPGQVLVVPGASSTAPTAPVKPQAATGPQQNVIDIANGELQAWQGGTVNRSTYYPAGGYGSADHAWCADFVSHVYQDAGYPLGDLQYPSLSGSASAPRLANWFAAGSATSDPYRVAIPANDPATPPQPGDVVFFGTDRSNSSSITHTGIVTAVYPDGSFDTVEGNINGTNEYDGEVATRHYTAEDRDKVYGFGRRLAPEPPKPHIDPPWRRYIAV